MIKLFVMDLDNTALGSNHFLSQSTIDALKDLSSTGVKVVFASGRVLSSVRYMMDFLNIDNPVIANNGAIISINKDNVLKRYEIEYDKIGSLIEFSQKYNLLYHFYDDDTFYSNSLNTNRLEHLKVKEQNDRYQVNLHIGDDPLKIVKAKKSKILKFQLTLNENNQKEMVEKLKKDFDNLYITYSNSNSIEIMNSKVNKYNSIMELADFFGFSEEEISAIGDYDNDIEMIENAKIGFCVNNANDKVKRISDYIVSDNDSNAIKEACEKIKEFNRC